MAFEANISRWRSALLTLGATGFVLIGLWMVGLIGSPPRISGFKYAMGWVCIVLFGALGMLWIRRLFQSGVEVRVDANGILYRRWSGQTIPWIAITRAKAMRLNNQRFLCLYLADPNAFPSVTVMGRLARANKSMGFGDVTVSMTGTDQSFDALMASVARYGPGRLQA